MLIRLVGDEHRRQGRDNVWVDLLFAEIRILHLLTALTKTTVENGCKLWVGKAKLWSVGVETHCADRISETRADLDEALVLDTFGHFLEFLVIRVVVVVLVGVTGTSIGAI